MDSVNGARMTLQAQPNVSISKLPPSGAASASGANAALRVAPASAPATAPAAGLPAPAADSAQFSAAASALTDLPEDFKASPDLMAAYKAAEEARAAMLAEGRTPTMSSIDAARIIALLS